MTMAPIIRAVSSSRPAMARAVAFGDPFTGVADRVAIPGMPSIPGIGPVICGSAVCGVKVGLEPATTAGSLVGAAVGSAVGWAAASTKPNVPATG